jgi:hypothetical protein
MNPDIKKKLIVLIVFSLYFFLLTRFRKAQAAGSVPKLKTKNRI